MQVGVLGETRCEAGGRPVDLGTRKQRAILAGLALSVGRPVSYDALVDLLWGDHPPDGLPGTLHVYIAGLRRALEPDRPPRTPATVLVTAGGGYALRVPADRVDAGRFDQVVTEVHRRLGRPGLLDPPRLGSAELTRLAGDLDQVLALWRGSPFADLEEADAAVAERARLEELRSIALEDRAGIALALGEHGTVAAELESLTASYPLRERLWGLRALALVRSGRQADALDALARIREILDDDLGLEPSPELRELQTAVLRQDPGLAWRPDVPPVPTAGPGAALPGRPVDQVVPAPAPWPLVGREAELAELRRRLDEAEAGVPAYVVLTGEPGIGKTRLCAELMAVAVSRGARVLRGRCSQDDGAPPLWPWQQVLRGLGEELPAPGAQDEGAEFRGWESIVALVDRAARTETLVIVLDDLHWADPPSLRVLRLLAGSVDAGRLLVLATWRSHPEPTGPLADVAEALARRHASRLALSGLDPAHTAAVVGAVADLAPSEGQAAELAARTDGNPFFLVEYARLARDGGDLAALLAEAEPPTAVNDVLLRRLARLPEESRVVLRWAAVVGREFRLDVLAEAAELPEDDVLDALDAALDAGLVREEGVGDYHFGHALVRDAVYGGFSATRRARAHARVAAVFAERPDRESECARHWLAAGPGHAGEAWRAASEAARLARRRHAHEQAAELLTAALGAWEADPAREPRDRYDLLMDLAEAHRWRGEWIQLLATLEQAVAVADEIGDVRLLGRAASAMTIGALWRSAPTGGVNEDVVTALRRSLGELPAADDPLRCRVMLALANELHFGAPFQERLALVEEALSMARRLGDPGTVMDACLVGFMALWRPDTVDQRLALATEAMEIAGALRAERSFTVAATLVAVAHGELGQVQPMGETAALARDYAERLRIPYGVMVLDALEVPWLAMAARFADAEQRLASVTSLAERMQLHQIDEALASIVMALRLWQGRVDEVLPMVLALDHGPDPMTTLTCLLLLRAGQVDRAREHLAAHEVLLDRVDAHSLLNWAAAAQTALGVGDRDLGARAYALLAPYAGHCVCSGSSMAMGPVDAFLALAAASTGELSLAAQHADDALLLMEEWQVPLAARWLTEERDRFGF